ncbi:MAG: hypothetical protein Q7R85_04280 [bacterium]|nr:hypothetical protein [bacterium]
MPEQELRHGSVVEDPDLAAWSIVDDLPRDVVLAYIFARAFDAPLGPKDAPLKYENLRNLSEDVCARNPRALDAHWRDGVAVVVIVDAVAREVHAIVRHGPVFRLMSRTMQ